MSAQTAKAATPQQQLKAAGVALVAGDAEASAVNLWQTVAEATAAVFRKRGWRYDGEGSIREVILRLDGKCADRRPLLPLLLTAEALRPPDGTYRHTASALQTIASGRPQGEALLDAFDVARRNIHPNSEKDFWTPICGWYSRHNLSLGSGG